MVLMMVFLLANCFKLVNRMSRSQDYDVTEQAITLWWWWSLNRMICICILLDERLIPFQSREIHIWIAV